MRIPAIPKQLSVRADPSAVRLRALELRDCLARDAPLPLRSDITDVHACALPDNDRGRTLLHHAAALGRTEHVVVLLEYWERCGEGGARLSVGWWKVVECG